MRVRSAVSLFLLLAGAVAGCATTPDAARLQADGETPRRVGPRERDMTAEAYYHYTVAQLAAQGGRFKDTLAPMEQALQRDPNSSFLWAQLAQWLVRAEQPAEALTAARKAVQLAPDEALLRLTAQQPRNVQAQFLLGRLAIESEQFDEAITRLSRAVELDPDHDGAWTALGYVYEAQHKTDEAIEIYRRAVKANPDN